MTTAQVSQGLVNGYYGRF